MERKREMPKPPRPRMAGGFGGLTPNPRGFGVR